MPFFPTGSPGWLIENFAFDIFIGVGAYLILVLGVPRLQKKARLFSYPDSKGVLRERPVHPHWFARYSMLKILALIVCVWGIFLYLVFSTGWRSPFGQVSWYGINVPGWFFDFAYARANNAPDGARLLSWIGISLFGLIICYKTLHWPPKKFMDILGDPFQGIAALVFLGGVHELPWVTLYYSAYWQYLNWTLLPEVVRDVSFVVMVTFFILTFWKYPGRSVPLKIFKLPVIAYLCYLGVWYFLPAVFGYHLLPITTLNNPAFGQGLYQETPWFSWWWVNLFEVGSWLILWVPSVVAVIGYKTKAQ